MQYYPETCALTSTPIYENQPCTMIILDKIWTQRIRRLNTPVGARNSYSQWKPFKEIHKGTYNDQGWINELELHPYQDEDQNPQCLFFHQAAWDWAVKTPEGHAIHKYFHDQWKEQQLEYKKDGHTLDSKTPEFEELQKVCITALRLRRDIFQGLLFQGPQVWEISESQEWIEEPMRKDFLDLQSQIDQEIANALEG